MASSRRWSSTSSGRRSGDNWRVISANTTATNSSVAVNAIQSEPLPPGPYLEPLADPTRVTRLP